MARADTNEHCRLVATSVGIAVPKDRNNWGYLSEVHGYGMNEQEAADLSEDLAAGMLGTTLGLEMDASKAWSEKEQVYKSSGLIIRTSNITQTARGMRELWTTTVAIAMFLFD
jgi:arginine decarboxylase